MNYESLVDNLSSDDAERSELDMQVRLDESILEDDDPQVIPTGPPFALEFDFWKHVAGSMLTGALMGLVGFVYLKTIETLQEKWWGDHYGETKASTELGAGKWEWAAYMGAGGLLVGVLKYVLRFPKVLPGFFREIEMESVHAMESPKVVVVSFVSLVAGASMGPEAALISLGGGVAQFISEQRGLPEEMRRRHVVNAMAGAMGPLFPSCVIAVLLLHELGRPETMHVSYMRSVILQTVAASISFAVYFSLQDGDTYMPFDKLKLTYHFKSGDQLKAVLIGICGGFIGVAHIVIVGIVRKAWTFLSSSKLFHDRENIKLILSPIIGGVLMSLIAVSAPLTLGSGSQQSKTILYLSRFNMISTETLLVTALAKSAAFAVSKSSGFVGGALFPLVFIGACVGVAVAQIMDDEEHYPLVFCCSCFMAAVPASIVAAPFSIMLLTAFTFELGSSQATPIFIAAVSAHVFSCGFGVLASIFNFAKGKPRPIHRHGSI